MKASAVRKLAAAAATALIFGTGAASFAASPPATWDNLSRVQSKRLKYVYLLPGAHFGAYTKVMLDPTEVAFRKDWQRDYNNSTRSLGSRITDADIERAVAEGGKAATEVFAQTFAKGGYPVVTQPGPDVLRVRTAVVDLHVAAPDKMTAGRSRSFSNEAGSATVIVEVRDSVSGAILGRAVDSRIVGDNAYMTMRTSVSNRADFENTVAAWAKACVNGLNELKTLSP